MTTWIAKDYSTATHVVDGYRDRVLIDNTWRWQAKTLCGRTVTGIGGETSFSPTCRSCAKSVAV